jgi:hypothetical protein
MDTNHEKVETKTPPLFFKKVIPTWFGLSVIILCATLGGTMVKISELSDTSFDVTNVSVVRVQKTETGNAITTVPTIKNSDTSTTTKR